MHHGFQRCYTHELFWMPLSKTLLTHLHVITSNSLVFGNLTLYTIIDRHECVLVCVSARARLCVCACACVRVCVPVYLCARVHMYYNEHTCVHQASNARPWCVGPDKAVNPSRSPTAALCRNVRSGCGCAIDKIAVFRKFSPFYIQPYLLV